MWHNAVHAMFVTRVALEIVIVNIGATKKRVSSHVKRHQYKYEQSH